jgi:surface polysaccharide O-acyltransferase-like enzyme
MSDEATGSGPRYHALDCARATAMLMGVFYHAIHAGMFGGGRWRQGGSGLDMLASLTVTEWMHSFRIPVFFAISGFFGHMMLGKYGTGRYLARRCWRIGAPMVVALFALSILHMMTHPELRGGLGGGNTSEPRPPLSTELKPFDKDGDGSFSRSEWKDVFAARQKSAAEKKVPEGGQHPGPVGLSPPGFDVTRFMPRVGPVSRWIFGDRAQHFTLGHLWFLWYLLVFTTLAPLLTRALGWLIVRPTPESADRFWHRSIRYGVAPFALGLLNVPALMQTRSRFGWSLGTGEGILGVFPDVLYRYQADMPFYFLYFLAGWGLYRLRDRLPDVARLWLPCLALGCLAFVAAGVASGVFRARTEMPYYGLIRLGGYVVSAVGSAYLAWGFIGFFQRYLDRPNRIGRYLADTAFWVYLVHQKLLNPMVDWLAPWHLYWWAQALIASAAATAAALVLFELLIRPTPLNRLVGAASPRRPAKPEPVDAEHVQFAADSTGEGHPA